MAVIHRSRCDRRKRRRAAWMMMIFAWPLAIAAAGLSVWFYYECVEELLETAGSWQARYIAWASAQEVVTGMEEWQVRLSEVLALLQQGLGWCIFGLTVALPGLIGAAISTIFACMCAPSASVYRKLRARIRWENAAMKLLSQMPDSCHLFLNKRIVFEDGTSETDVIIVAPGGTVVVDIKGWAGMIEGVVTEAVLYRRQEDGTVDKLRNPARLVVSHVMRLQAYLRSVEVNTAVLPCVLFVDPAASVFVRPPADLIISERRSRISSCIMADATGFWERLGRDLVSGRQQNKAAVEQIVSAIRKAPGGRRRAR